MRTLVTLCATVGITLAAVPAAFAQAQQEPSPKNRFCMETGSNGDARCAYQTLAQCERARPRGSTGRCFDKTYMIAATPPAETTGSAERSPAARGGKRGKAER